MFASSTNAVIHFASRSRARASVLHERRDQHEHAPVRASCTNLRARISGPSSKRTRRSACGAPTRVAPRGWGVPKRRSGRAGRSYAGTTWSAASAGGPSTPSHARARGARPPRGATRVFASCTNALISTNFASRSCARASVFASSTNAVTSTRERERRSHSLNPCRCSRSIRCERSIFAMRAARDTLPSAAAISVAR